MADALALGIPPGTTVRIRDMRGWACEWPWDTVELEGDRIVVKVQLVSGERRILYYPYESSEQVEPGLWLFHGRETWTVTAGAAEPLSMQ